MSFNIVKFLLTAAVVCASSSLYAASLSYSTGFEEFALGPISSGGTAQQGWSGGAQPDFTNNDSGDEQIINTQAYAGAQSWHYARGYNSPGQGTAFTPNLSTALTTTGQIFSGSVRFKAADPGDNSSFALEGGNLAGDDRSEILAYIENTNAGGIVVRSFDGGAFTPVPVASGLDAALWHLLEFSVTKYATGNTVSISVDGLPSVMFDGSLAQFRNDLSFPYSETSRLKIRPRHADGDLTFSGFYLDDVSYAVTAEAVPEPGTIGLLALGGIVGLVAIRRRRKIS